MTRGARGKRRNERARRRKRRKRRRARGGGGARGEVQSRDGGARTSGTGARRRRRRGFRLGRGRRASFRASGRLDQNQAIRALGSHPRGVRFRARGGRRGGGGTLQTRHAVAEDDVGGGGGGRAIRARRPSPIRQPRSSWKKSPKTNPDGTRERRRGERGKPRDAHPRSVVCGGGESEVVRRISSSFRTTAFAGRSAARPVLRPRSRETFSTTHTYSHEPHRTQS